MRDRIFEAARAIVSAHCVAAALLGAAPARAQQNLGFETGDAVAPFGWSAQRIDEVVGPVVERDPKKTVSPEKRP